MFNFARLNILKTSDMKTSTIVMIAAAAALTIGCSPKKSVEEKLAELNAWNAAFGEFAMNRLMQLEDSLEAQQEFLDSASAAYLEYNMAALNENLDNEVGVVALKEVYNDLDDEEMLDVLGKLTAPLDFQDSLFVAGLKTSVESRVNTAEGKMFTDFEVDGVKFSDFVGKGKYVLVDFWASWCGPCRKEIPNIKSVYEEFHGDDFDVLSVAVWDKIEDTQKAIEEEQLPWNQILQANTIPTDIYGIQGIPHIILFGPDGTILKRGLRGEDIHDAVEEALNR